MNIILLVAVVVLAAALVFVLFSRAGKKMVLGTAPTGPADHELSLKDPVTGLYNKKHLMQRLQESMARNDREKKQLALVLWDVDGFTKFNNDFGSREGDRLLQQVATSIKKSVRVYDEIFRSGPDEFCAILGPADSEIAQQVTRRVSDLVSKELFQGSSEYAQQNFSLTSGFVFYPDANLPGSHEFSPDALLHAANQALYKASHASPNN